MTRTKIKQEAKKQILHAIQMAFKTTTTSDIQMEMSHQMARIEKLFGYTPHSFIRGY